MTKSIRELLKNMRAELRPAKKGAKYYFDISENPAERQGEFNKLVEFLTDKELYKHSRALNSNSSCTFGLSYILLEFRDASYDEMVNRLDTLLEELEQEEIERAVSLKDSKLQTNMPIVAITFYSKRNKTGKGYYDGIFTETERKDVLHLKNGLQAAAKARQQPLPQIEITVFLIPNWREGETYRSPAYLAAKKRMLDEARWLYGEGIIVKDFLEDSGVTQEELDFLQHCESMGSVADLVKSRTIIDNAGRPCLQTDSNVTWANNDFERLYELTFLQNTDAFNVSRCSDVYIAAHNKLIFIGSQSKLPEILQGTLVEYCRKYKEDPWHMNRDCNGVYDFAFCEAMYKHGATYIVRVNDRYNVNQVFDFYPANLKDSRYRLIPMVIPCQRETWRGGKGEESLAVKELLGELCLEDGSKIPALTIEINGVHYNFNHFKSIVKVYTNCPLWHTFEGNYQYFFQTGDKFKEAKYCHQKFLEKLDKDLCMLVLTAYYEAARTVCLAREGETKWNPLRELTKLFIKNEEASEALCQRLFNCTVAELHENPDREIIYEAHEFTAPIISSYASKHPSKFFSLKFERTPQHSNEKINAGLKEIAGETTPMASRSMEI
ncbi:hypothetical protein [Legionella oakridgensis]|uniref:Uncharacterized protein n=3 Tax=Legionella oakridgensis TaxID=29423 RepID=W0BBF5_9GAMM|nr:hypothetical protein [Legionella oakridgensis]AHE66031.1 hypothetical protein Loa_00454 [Legionella oakridgensis ATCC 33761 = DSM 21215]ETO94261.1 hypothetical protein LOR_83c24060 [Legionella oakridgensis RV-2-2007]KTD43562.1 hypothetical protein Loak_0538 [Legionella oakridgensis]STY15955.1 Uncharacterised protein [Legionella longbeachae]